jgi:hypothetical protein
MQLAATAPTPQRRLHRRHALRAVVQPQVAPKQREVVRGGLKGEHVPRRPIRTGHRGAEHAEVGARVDDYRIRTQAGQQERGFKRLPAALAVQCGGHEVPPRIVCVQAQRRGDRRQRRQPYGLAVRGRAAHASGAAPSA